MGTYGLEGVMRAWELEKLTTEQAIGQILQLIAEIEGRLRDLERKYSKINKTSPPTVLASQPQEDRAEENEVEENEVGENEK